MLALEEGGFAYRGGNKWKEESPWNICAHIDDDNEEGSNSSFSLACLMKKRRRSWVKANICVHLIRLEITFFKLIRCLQLSRTMFAASDVQFLITQST